jgi:toxin secretion/phage lysis holin
MKTLCLIVVAAAVLDYVTGMLAAAKEGTVSSAVGIGGIFKKLALFCALGLGLFLDYALPALIGSGFPIQMDGKLPFGLVLAGWIVLNESVSVTENLARCGVKLPSVLQKLLKRAAKEEEEEK